ncbi:hypothetical protein HK096_010332, partial [Nowakowskiella sp. JEL0078]
MGVIAQAADLLALSYATFFMKEPSLNALNSRPSWLFLYFSSREIRSAFYIGLSAWLLSQHPEAVPRVTNSVITTISTLNQISSIHDLIISSPVNKQLFKVVLSASFLAATGFSGLIHHFTLALKKKKQPGDWWTYASDGLSWSGLWWIGFGSSDWFAFAGHNSQEEAIVPSIFMEQMKKRKTGRMSPVSNIEEIHSDEEI